MTSRPKGTGCIFMRPDSNKWWIKYSRNGKPYRESTNSTNRRKAEKMLKLRLAEIATDTFVGPHTERVRVEDLWDDVEREYRINGRKSLDDAQARWKLHLKPMFGPVRALEVGTTILGRYVDLRQIEGARMQPSTGNWPCSSGCFALECKRPRRSCCGSRHSRS